MDYREKAFRAKFTTAAQHLGVTADEVISLKLREQVARHTDYQHLLHILEHEVGIGCHGVAGDLQGAGHLVGDSKVRAIVVEHETGLEILYIAGSIASLVCLIPLILQCWSGLRDDHGTARPRAFRSVEVRRLDSAGRLLEERARGLAAPWSAPLSFVNTALTSAAEVIDEQIKTLRDHVGQLARRIAALEKKSPKAAKTRKKTAKKARR